MKMLVKPSVVSISSFQRSLQHVILGRGCAHFALSSGRVPILHIPLVTVFSQNREHSPMKNILMQPSGKLYGVSVLLQFFYQFSPSQAELFSEDVERVGAAFTRHVFDFKSPLLNTFVHLQSVV